MGMNDKRLKIFYRMAISGEVYTTYVNNLSDVKDGFWITREGQFTKKSDNYAFVLPHMINHILNLRVL